MEPNRVERKLAAILYADVADYSRLTGEDEEGTHRTLSACLDAITIALLASTMSISDSQGLELTEIVWAHIGQPAGAQPKGS